MSLFCAILVCLADILVGTWNMKWFPSGRAEHRAKPEVEARTYEQAAQVVRDALSHRQAGDHVVFFLEEMRDEATCANLVARIGDPSLSCACVTAFREFDRRLGWQQVGIVTDLPVLDAHYSYWKRQKTIHAPRGFAMSLLDAGDDGLVACYGIHLKSNYGAKTPEVRASNQAKREICTDQLVNQTRKVSAPDGRPVKRFIIAGDFNTDPFSGQFAGERTIPTLEAAGYTNCFAGTSPAERGTHPGWGRYPDSTLDFVFHRGFSRQQGPWLMPRSSVSDHRMVLVRLAR